MVMRSRTASALVSLRDCRAFLLVALVAILGLPSNAISQPTVDGTIRGIIRDEQGAVLSGVTIAATSPDSSAVARATSDDMGSYRLLNLPPGTYDVSAELPGFSPIVRKSIGVRAGLNLALDLTLKVGQVSETVSVENQSPLLESKTGSQAINLTGTFQRSLPLTTNRQWASGLLLTPGVVLTEISGTLYFQLHGADPASNVLQIDGAEVGSPGDSSPQYVQMSAESIQDVQIKTAGSDASVPLGQGAVVNVASRAGTDALNGSFSSVLQNHSWSSSNQPGGVSPVSTLAQYDMSLGGPIVRQRAWYFGSYRGERSSNAISRTANDLAIASALAPGFVPYNTEVRVNAEFIKPVWSITPGQRLSSFTEHTNRTNRGGSAVTLTQSTADFIGGTVHSDRLDSVWTDRLLTHLSFAYNDNSARTDLTTGTPSQTVYQTISNTGATPRGVTRLGILGASRQFGFELPSTRLTISADASYYLPAFAGTHELQVGLYSIPYLHTSTTYHYAGDGVAAEDLVLSNPADRSSARQVFHRRIYDLPDFDVSSSRSSDTAAYVQDLWRPIDRLSLGIGVRIDHVNRFDRIFNQESQSSTQVGPRLSANWAVDHVGRTHIKATWGRVHEMISLTGASLGTATPTFRDEYDRNLDGVFETVLTTPGVTALSNTRIIDLAHRHQPYVDEWTLTGERQVGSGTTVSIGVAQRQYRDRTAFVDTNGIYSGNQFLGYRDVTNNEIYLITNNVWNWPVVTDAQALVTRQVGSLTLIGSYVRQWRHIAGTWQPNDPAAIVQPDAFANDKGIGLVVPPPSVVADANSLDGQNMTQTAGAYQWHDHVARMGITWNAPAHIQAAATWEFQSGLWSGPVYTQLAAPDPQFGPASLTLSNGRVATNPLATTLRFVGPTRGDGQLRLPNFQSLNLSVGWRPTIRRVRLDITGRVFNLTNSDADQSFAGVNWTFDPSYGKTTFRQSPRSAQIGVGVNF